MGVLGASSVVIQHLQAVLGDLFLPFNLSVQEFVTANREGAYKLRRTSSSISWVWEFAKVGAKRRFRDELMFQHERRTAISGNLHVPTKKVRIVGPHDPDSSSTYYEASTFIRYKDDCRYMIFNFVMVGREFSSLPGDMGCKLVAASGILRPTIVGAFLFIELCDSHIPRTVLPWFSSTRRSRRFGKVGSKPRVEPSTLKSLPYDLQGYILQKVEFRDLVRFKILSTSCRDFIERGDASRRRLGPEGQFTAISYHIKNNQWRCSGFDLKAGTWKRLPSLSPPLPAPDAQLFKEYSVCGDGGLICADIAKLPEKGKLVVLNLLTQKTRDLPKLLHPRTPVLVHMWVDESVNGSSRFKVVVAGSSSSSDEKLSRKMEVFDSETSAWEAAPDVPGPAFGLNEHQVGVCVDGVLHFISFLDESDGYRGVVAFDLKTRTWLRERTCRIPFSTCSNTLQLVGTKSGKVCLFSEQERAGSVTHCIDVLELVDHDNKWKLRNVVRVKNSGGRGLQVYPEHTCVSFGDEKLCIFNTLTRSGVVYDLMQDGKEVETLEPPPFDKEPRDNFFSLNPASFVLSPTFTAILEKTNESE